MTMGMKAISEYNRQYTWHEIAPANPIAGCPSFKEHKVAEPPLQANQRPTLELASKEELPEVVRTFGSPSKKLHIVREPSFSHKKRVPGASPERMKVDKSLEKKAGLSKNINTARYKSEYAARFSPTKGIVPRPSSPIQNSKINFVDSKTNLPIGKKPVDKKVRSEYESMYQDPTSELHYVRELYKEQVRRKRLELEKAKPVEEAVPVKKPEVKEPEIKKLITKAPEKKVKLKIVSPLKGVPKIKATYDIIAAVRPTKLKWKSEYKSKFESPTKEAPIAPSAYGRRSHPYKAASPERVANLIRPDPSEIATPKPANSVNWYSEVVELRQLAQEFKARSHGSHFSPNKMAHLSFSTARLREFQPIPSPPGSAESVRVIPKEKQAAAKEVALPIAVPAVIAETPKLENDIVVTDLEDTEEVPNIDHLVIKTESLIDDVSKNPSPVKARSKSPDSVSSKKAPKEVAVIAEKEASVCSTPRTADRSFSLFGDRVPTPRLRNQGSRHHLDRTTRKDKSEPAPEIKTAVLAGRVATPTLQEQGGSRHHLDSTTPAPVKTDSKLPEGTQPFFPILSDQIKEKLDFSSPSKPAEKANGWPKDLDESVLSRASSCTSLASATLNKAQKRGTDFWKSK